MITCVAPLVPSQWNSACHFYMIRALLWSRTQMFWILNMFGDGGWAVLGCLLLHPPGTSIKLGRVSKHDRELTPTFSVGYGGKRESGWLPAKRGEVQLRKRIMTRTWKCRRKSYGFICDVRNDFLLFIMLACQMQSLSPDKLFISSKPKWMMWKCMHSNYN